MRKIAILFLLVLLILPAVYSLSASIGNARAVIRVNASPEDPAILDRTILANNKNDIPVVVTLTPNKEFEKFVDIADEEFELQPNESKNAEFTLTIDRGGTFEGKILVGFSPADPESRENSVGLSSTLIVISEGPIIEEPEEEEVVEEPAATEPTETQEEPQEQDETEGVTVITSNPYQIEEEAEINEQTEIPEARTSPLIGILITSVIVAVGLLVIFLVMKAIKK